jgi:hypothetical protein
MNPHHSPAFLHAMTLARRIPNHPHPDRARAVHEWAQALLRVIRETR